MIYARIADGRVAELVEVPAEGPPLAARFHPSIVAACVALTPAQAAEVREGWRWDGAAFLPPPPPPSPTAEELRARRDALLVASDWTQLPDAPLAAERRAAWQSYRQALRDVPQQPGFPGDVVWPTAPTAL